MANDLKLEIVRREIIKPSSPTPDHLRKFDLSLVDQIFPHEYVSLLLYYPPKLSEVNLSGRLKSSLSETLTRFYPFAGRIKDDVSVECNDEEVVFVEARVDRVMSEFLKQPDPATSRKFLSDTNDKTRGPLLQVQVNFFSCGGLVIGLSMLHKLTDASTLRLFVKAWSATSSAPNCNNANIITFADFSMASILPAKNPATVPQYPFGTKEGEVAMKRYVFEKSEILLLKAQAISQGLKQPTRVECVSALLWKSATDASRSRFRNLRPSIFMQFVDLRQRMAPSLPENTIGNIVFISMANIEANTKNIELQKLIINIKKSVRETNEVAANGSIRGEASPLFIEMAKETGNMAKRDDTDFYMSTSWCRFSFYEAADFGWGKPIWMSPNIFMKNLFILVDSADGVGIEAWCSLHVEDIALIERNKEFLEFANINPTIHY